MIKIEAIAYNNLPLSQPISVEFGELGGNIGRADGNTLVLNDPERRISRIHASIVHRRSNYFIRGLGAMPVYLNEQPLNNDQDTPITDGDRIRIGDYEMQVIYLESASDSLFRPEIQHQLMRSSGGSNIDSLADLLSFPERPVKQNPLTLESEVADSTASRNLYSSTSVIDITPKKQIIPSDFDAFAMPHEEEKRILESAFFNDLDHFDKQGRGLDPREKQPTIDDVIIPPDPLLNLSAQTNKGVIDDPLIALDNAEKLRKATYTVQRDDASELESSLPPMHVYEHPVEVPTSSNPVPPLANHTVQRDDASELESSLPSMQMYEQSIDAPAHSNAEPPLANSLSSHEELMQAFISGIGVSDLDKRIELTPQFMNQIGQLLRTSTQGTLDLLRARTLMKREMHAVMTIIEPRGNNPLKHVPSVEGALIHLLAPNSREKGFLPPLLSLKDAYNDLRSHQLGFMAGMRGALSGILKRFNPNNLEKRLEQRAVIDSIFSFNRKAKLWGMFTDRYEDISREAEDDFHVLFSKEFLQAYEAQIARFESEDKKI